MTKTNKDGIAITLLVDTKENKNFKDALFSVLRYPEMITAIANVLEYGIKKGYEDENWLKPDGKRMSRKENFDSISHHNALHFSGIDYDESRLRHLAHAATRNLMELTRLERGIIHTNDQLEVLEELSNEAQKQGLYDMIPLDDSGCLTIEEALEKYKGGKYMVDVETIRSKLNEGNKQT